MNNHNVDVVVIGAGPGGYVAAIRSSQLGLKTICVEREHLGGICLNWGCIPTKALLASAEYMHFLKKPTEYGFNVFSYEVDFAKVVSRSRDVASRMSQGIAFLFKKYGVTQIIGSGYITNKNTIEVKNADGEITDIITAKHIIIATGARPRMFAGIEVDREKVITSREAMIQQKVPKSLVIMGGGAIGVEFAYFYNMFGSQVTIVEMQDRLLPIEDADISKELERNYRKEKIRLLTNAKVLSAKTISSISNSSTSNSSTSISSISNNSTSNNSILKDKTSNTSINSNNRIENNNEIEKVERIENNNEIEKVVEVVVEKKDGTTETLVADLALNAIGIQANTENLGLENIGIETKNGFISVDKNLATSISNIYAIGDIAGAPWLAHKASAEGIAVAERIAGHTKHIDYKNIPGCVYCQPQVASVGVTEAKAIELGFNVKVGKFPFTASGKAHAIGEARGFVKLIFDAKTDELLGAHLIGPEVTELLAELCLARTNGLKAKQIIDTIHAHPTLSEVVMEAAAAAYNESVNF